MINFPLQLPSLALNSLEGHTCSSGATTLGLATTTTEPSQSEPHQTSDTHTITTTTALAAAASTPSSTDCCEDWVHIDTAPDDTLTASTGTLYMCISQGTVVPCI